MTKYRDLHPAIQNALTTHCTTYQDTPSHTFTYRDRTVGAETRARYLVFPPLQMVPPDHVDVHLRHLTKQYPYTVSQKYDTLAKIISLRCNTTDDLTKIHQTPTTSRHSYSTHYLSVPSGHRW